MNVCRLVAFVALAGNIQASAQERSSTETVATVVVRVIDENGFTVPEFHVDRFADGHDVDLSSRFQDLRAPHVPYGSYSYKLKRTLGARDVMLQGRTYIALPEQLIVVRLDKQTLLGMSIDRAIPREFVIRGKIQPMPAPEASSEPVWVRLLPVFGIVHMDVDVNATGDFRIYEPLSGPYVLNVIRGDQVLHVQQVVFEDGLRLEDFVVNLSQGPAQVLHVRKK